MSVDVQDIARADARLEERYAKMLIVNPRLDRKLVSFQANKAVNSHRWYKYKEGFSVALIRYVLEEARIDAGPVLDPFAGSGTTLFAARERGIDSVGIELLPHSIELIEVRQLLHELPAKETATALRNFRDRRSWEEPGEVKPFRHLRITDGAFPENTEHALFRYLWDADAVSDRRIARVLRFAVMCVLEEVSYTRKDGQYLRWDWRSGRRAGQKEFNKGPIVPFTRAITSKLTEIADDLHDEFLLFRHDVPKPASGNIKVVAGSCLEILPQMKARSFGALVTSPPYCNRYDYTRTYALELALMGIGEQHLKTLRQTMLSCTVENLEKHDLERHVSAASLKAATDVWSSHELLNLILAYLDSCRDAGTLNNNGIPRMVRNYFREMAVVIFEAARVLKAGAPLIMVNDNVRYQGVHVPVDLILSDFASKAGFDVERIWVLPRGKGNSSQQMGAHGREEVRKCVYVWRKPKAKRATRPDLEVAEAL